MRPTPEPFDPYATLGIALGADRADIRRAYRRRARELHPDATGADTTSAMARLNRAREEALRRTAPGGTGGTRRRSGPGAAGGTAEPHPTSGHEHEWDDYWSAWNDPPRRWRSGDGGGSTEG